MASNHKFWWCSLLAMTCKPLLPKNAAVAAEPHVVKLNSRLVTSVKKSHFHWCKMVDSWRLSCWKLARAWTSWVDWVVRSAHTCPGDKDGRCAPGRVRKMTPLLSTFSVGWEEQTCPPRLLCDIQMAAYSPIELWIRVIICSKLSVWLRSWHWNGNLICHCSSHLTGIRKGVAVVHCLLVGSDTMQLLVLLFSLPRSAVLLITTWCSFSCHSLYSGVMQKCVLDYELSNWSNTTACHINCTLHGPWSCAVQILIQFEADLWTMTQLK